MILYHVPSVTRTKCFQPVCINVENVITGLGLSRSRISIHQIVIERAYFVQSHIWVRQFQCDHLHNFFDMFVLVWWVHIRYRRPSCPYKALKFKFSVSGRKNVPLFDVVTKTSVLSEKNRTFIIQRVISTTFHL